MMGGTSAFEVIALFAVAALVCWPTLRRRMPAFGTRAEAIGAPASMARFEPRRSGRHDRCQTDMSTYAAPVALAPEEYYEEEISAPAVRRTANRWPADDDLPVRRSAHRRPDAQERPAPRPSAERWAEEEEEEGVLPLAEALLRGERILSRPAPQPEPEPVAEPVVQPFKVLLVDARDKFRTTMLLRLARTGHRVFPVARAAEALDVFTRERSDLILIHRDALRELGPDFLRRIRATVSHVPILVHGGGRSNADLDAHVRNFGITLVAGAGDDTDVIADMVDCSLAAARAIRRVRDDQEVRGKILSELSYNLRSSLDVITGYTDILSDEPDLSGYRDVLERMRASTTAATAQMQSCVDVALDVPDCARQERVDLSSLSQKIERLVTRQIGTHPLRLTTSGPMQGSALFTDGEKLLAILSHVVTDAVKFTPNGEINIALRSLPDRTDFVVTDSGPGISADVPLPFAAVPPHGAGDTGTAGGVGLTIAERLSRSIGATLTGRCGEGGAASFTISVPGKLMQTQNAARTLH